MYSDAFNFWYIKKTLIFENMSYPATFLSAFKFLPFPVRFSKTVSHCSQILTIFSLLFHFLLCGISRVSMGMIVTGSSLRPPLVLDFKGKASWSSPFKCLLLAWDYCSVTLLCLTLCEPADCSTPGSLVLHYLPELAQTHVHWVCDTVQPSHPLPSPSPPAFNFVLYHIRNHSIFSMCYVLRHILDFITCGISF